MRHSHPAVKCLVERAICRCLLHKRIHLCQELLVALANSPCQVLAAQGHRQSRQPLCRMSPRQKPDQARIPNEQGNPLLLQCLDRIVSGRESDTGGICWGSTSFACIANLLIMSPNQRGQSELDFGHGDTSGYDRWQQERAERLDRIRRKFGLPINRRVRVRLRDIDGEFCGLLTLVELPIDLRKPHHQRLRIGDYEFTATEIESCVRED
jgi:hypothetical protein